MKKYYFLVFIFLFIFLSLCVFDFLIFKKNKNLLSEIRKEKEKEMLIDIEKKELEELKDFLKKEKALEIEKQFVSKDNPVDFINFLEDFLEDQGLSAKIVLQAVQNQRQGNFFIFKIIFSSSFEKIYHFLKKIENVPYFVKIERINLSVAEKNGVKVEIDLKVLSK